MKRIFHMRKLIIAALLVFILTGLFHISAAAEAAWEPVSNSDDFATDGFFADDFDVASDGTVYCLDSVLGELVLFDGGGNVLLSEPAQDYARLCLSSDDRTLYLLSTADNAITKISLDTGGTDTIDLTSSDIPASMPVDLALSPENDIYVADYEGNCVCVYRTDGSAERLSDTGGAGALSMPFCIDVNSQGKLAVALAERNQTLFSNPYGEGFMASDTTGAEGGVIEYLYWTAIDDYGNVYQADSATGRIIVLSDGIFRTLYPVATDDETVMSICSTGNYLYVCLGAADFSSFRIVRCAINNEILRLSFQGVEASAEIDAKKHTITVTVPYDTDMTALKPDIVVSDGADVSLAPGSTYDFTDPVTCSVLSGVFGTTDYIITVLQTALPTGQTPEQGPETAGPATDVSNSTETSVLSADMAQSGTGMVLPILLATAYLALLIVWIVLIFALRKRRKHRPFIAAAIVWVLFGVALLLVGLWLSKDANDPVYVEDAAYETDSFEPYGLTGDQRAVLEEFGYPEGFLILYADRVRQETWFYHTQGLVVDFLGGVELQRGYDADLTEYDAGKTVYTPNDFVFGMTPGTALSAAGIDDFIMEPLDDELVRGGVLYYGDGIVLGFIDDELYYVETILSEE